MYESIWTPLAGELRGNPWFPTTLSYPNERSKWSWHRMTSSAVPEDFLLRHPLVVVDKAVVIPPVTPYKGMVLASSVSTGVMLEPDSWAAYMRRGTLSVS